MTVQAHVMPHWRATPGLSPHLVCGSDVALRTRWFVPASFQHPAKLHLGLLHWLIEGYTLPGETIADPMAGSGGILLPPLFKDRSSPGRVNRTGLNSCKKTPRMSLHTQDYSPDTSILDRLTHAISGDIPLIISCSARPMGVKSARSRTATGLTLSSTHGPGVLWRSVVSVSRSAQSGQSRDACVPLGDASRTNRAPARETLLGRNTPHLHAGVHVATPTGIRDSHRERPYSRWKASGHGCDDESAV
jgi:hypothetical protein